MCSSDLMGFFGFAMFAGMLAARVLGGCLMFSCGTVFRRRSGMAFLSGRRGGGSLARRLGRLGRDGQRPDETQGRKDEQRRQQAGQRGALAPSFTS